MSQRYVIEKDGQFLTAPPDSLEYTWGRLENACIYKSKTLAEEIIRQYGGKVVRI